MKLKRGQVWVETVIYTLIGLAIIGIVMAMALPKINERKDEIVIGQSIEALGNIDDTIYETVNNGVGNRRVVDLEIKKGALIIDAKKNTISWELDSSFEYSESGVPISIGRLNVTTVSGAPWKVELKLSYNIDLRFDGENTGIKRLDASPTSYRLVVENMGKESGNIVVDLRES
jgi:type II secretory pathway pseudopilin PulG